MITLMEIINQRVNTTPLAFVDGASLASDPVRVRSIDGLGPVPAEIVTQDYALIDGGFYVGSNVSKRNIVITFGLNPSWVNQAPENLRAYLYQYFMPKSKVTLRFTSTHMDTVTIDGYVESMEPNIFSADPQIVTSIICPNPAFQSVYTPVLNGQSGDYVLGNPTPLNYSGTIDCGFTIQLLPTSGGGPASPGSFYISVVGQDAQVMKFVSGYLDQLGGYATEICSVPGNKYAKSYVPTSPTLPHYTNLLPYLVNGSSWLKLRNGVNTIKVGTVFSPVPYTITFRPLYGGI